MPNTASQALSNCPSFDHLSKIAQNNFPAAVVRNANVARLYQEAIYSGDGMISASGAIATTSGAKTGRVPNDKRIVKEGSSENDVWWGPVNIPLTSSSFEKLRQQATDHLDRCSRLYIFDGFAGWDPENQLKVRIVCSRPYHALFMNNMLIRPTAEQLKDFGTPDFVIYNAGTTPADQEVDGVTSDASICVNFAAKEMVILGTQYAGEMKKGVFTVMNYLMPKKDVLSMHCSANEGDDDDVTLFFGLSGTGKTTLSADGGRKLIGDDEHCWTDSGVFNIEGGCYAKCLGLSAEKEPQIFSAVRFGSVLENTVQDAITYKVDYEDDRLTQNTRVAYPIDYIKNAKIPCVGSHPKNIVLLTCDAFGVLPPVARLTPEQAMYHFISGYTAKIAGTEIGITQPKATFSACFGAAFLVWHPTKYAELLAEKMRDHNTKAWLVNTGWTGGPHGVGSRMHLTHTRSIIDAINNDLLGDVSYNADPVFGFDVPNSCPEVPTTILQPKAAWNDDKGFDEAAAHLATRFHENFKQYEDQASQAIREAGPRI